MADTEHTPVSSPVEGDGLSYRGVVWFVVILSGTVLFSMALVWGAFAFMASRGDRADRTVTARAPLGVPVGEMPPGPNLLVDEPGNLRQFREAEDNALTRYGWADEATGTARIPVDRAKEILLERGAFPVRGETATPPAE